MNSRRPGTFWQLSYPATSAGSRDVQDYEYAEEEEHLFDDVWFRLKQGSSFDGIFPKSLRLWVSSGSEPIADHVGNASGFTIMSERLLEFLEPLIAGCVETFPAPLFDIESREPIDGFYVVNVTKALDCVDKSRSVPWFDEDGELLNFTEVCIDASRTGGANIFKYVVRPGYCDTGVTCSYDLVNSLVGKGFTGLAFFPCASAD